MRVNFYDLAHMSQPARAMLCRRTGLDMKALIAQVEPLIEDVHNRGDEAVTELTKRFDHADMQPQSFRVSKEEMDGAPAGLPHDLRDAMEVSIANIRRFHERQVEKPAWEMEISPGIVAGEKIVPIPSVGLYSSSWQGLIPIHDDDVRGPGESGRCATDRRRYPSGP